MTVLKGLRAIVGIGLSFVALAPMADVDDELDRWFNDMNYSTSTNPGVYEGQSARYATLGGVSTRAPIREPFHFVDVQTPKMTAGCGGIDFYAGGFSAIDKDAFVENLRAIGQNAQSLGFMLAIQVVSPQLSGQMEKVQTWANKFNQMGMDSCQAAQSLVGGGMDMLGAKAGNCTIKRMSEFGEDYRTAEDACLREGRMSETEASGSTPNTADFVKGNLAWYVLMQDPFFRSDTEFAELMMNLTGTVILTEGVGGRISTDTLNPAITKDRESERFRNIYTALLHGSESDQDLALYTCEDDAANPDACLELSSTLQSIDPSWSGMYSKIDELVSGIVDSIYADTPLTDSQRGLISTTNIPLYRYLAAAAAHHPKGTDLSRMTSNYTELIASDIIMRSLTSIVERIEQQSASLPEGISSSTTVVRYREDIDSVLAGLSAMHDEVKFDAEQYYTMQRRIQLYEKSLMSRLSSGLVNSASWGN